MTPLWRKRLDGQRDAAPVRGVCQSAHPGVRRPRTAAAGGRPQAGLDGVEKSSRPSTGQPEPNRQPSGGTGHRQASHGGAKTSASGWRRPALRSIAANDATRVIVTARTPRRPGRGGRDPSAGRTAPRRRRRVTRQSRPITASGPLVRARPTARPTTSTVARRIADCAHLPGSAKLPRLPRHHEAGRV
jgi:hypothetical protein